MRFITFALLLLQAATPAQQKRVAWIPNPRPSGGWVADPSHHLKPATIDSLNALASALERETSDEIAIVVVDSTSGLEPEDFALAVHRAWGVGKASRDNGVVVLWVPAQRALQVSVGYGLEGRLIDGRVGRIRDEQFFPAFKAKEFDRGMLDGVGALVAAAREEGTPIERFKPGAAHSTPTRERSSSGLFAVLGSIVAGLLALLGILIWVKTVRHRRHHPCPKCRSRMRYIDAPAERLPLLDAGQRVEERLGSVHHDLWVCPSCGTRDSDAHVKSHAIEPCPKCKYRTVQKDTKVTVHATTRHTGEEKVTWQCANCDYSKEQLIITPKVVESDGGSSAGSSFGAGGGSSGGSSGGGGGGSFGGGSAGGGGAGGHY